MLTNKRAKKVENDPNKLNVFLPTFARIKVERKEVANCSKLKIVGKIELPSFETVETTYCP